MNEAVIREKLMELTEALQADSKGDSDGMGEYVSQSQPQTDAVIDHLRLQIKYLLFDLEASHRENRYLRQMLEIRPPRSGDGESE